MSTQSTAIALAEAKLAAAKKRVMAAQRLATIAAYERQAGNPAYPGQSAICLGKAEIERSLYERDLAEADLIIARAEQEARQ